VFRRERRIYRDRGLICPRVDSLDELRVHSFIALQRTRQLSHTVAEAVAERPREITLDNYSMIG